MITFTREELERYDKMMPKNTDLNSLEQFLRTIPMEELNDLKLIGLKMFDQNVEPFEQFYMLILLGNIFFNEFGDGVDLFTKKDFLTLIPIFVTSILYEYLFRVQNKKRLLKWRSLSPSDMMVYKEYEENVSATYDTS